MPVRTSVIVTNFNYGRFLTQAVDSALAQRDSEPFEVIVLDDGSTDDSDRVLRTYERDPRVRIVRNQGVGIERQSNMGLQLARGELIVRLDADDFFAPELLATLVPVLDADPSLAFAYADYFIVDADGGERRVTLPPFAVAEIQARGDFLATGTVYRKRLLIEVGGFPELERNCGLENYHLIAKLLHAGHPGRHVPQPRFYYRKHAASLTVARGDAITRYGQKMASMFGFEYRTNEYRP
jgi:glycosyltransferase involved in cell wall biosynthesis